MLIFDVPTLILPEMFLLFAIPLRNKSSILFKPRLQLCYGVFSSTRPGPHEKMCYYFLITTNYSRTLFASWLFSSISLKSSGLCSGPDKTSVLIISYQFLLWEGDIHSHTETWTIILEVPYWAEVKRLKQEPKCWQGLLKKRFQKAGATGIWLCPRHWVFLSPLSQRITVYSGAQWPAGDACWVSFCEWSFSHSSVLENRLGYRPALFWVLSPHLCLVIHSTPSLSFSQILKLYSLGILDILDQINYS